MTSFVVCRLSTYTLHVANTNAFFIYVLMKNYHGGCKLIRKMIGQFHVVVMLQTSIQEVLGSTLNQDIGNPG